MRNKFIILLMSVFMILCGAAKAEDEASISDLQDAEKGIELLQDKLLRREYDIGKREKYAKVHASEMNKCGELKQEIWKLKDEAKALNARLAKLTADKEKAEAEFARQTGIYEAREKEIRASESGIGASEKRHNLMAAANGKESDERKKKIDALREGLKSSVEKAGALTREKDKIDDDLKAKDAEYKAETDKLKALEDRLALQAKEAPPQDSAGKDTSAKPAKSETPEIPAIPVKDESPEIKKNIDALMASAQKLESARQKLSEEILAEAAVKKSLEEKIKALEDEDASKAKDLESRSEGLSKDVKAARVKIEKLHKKTLSAKFKARTASASVKKMEDDIKKAAQEKLDTEKALKEKTDEFKVRISVLLDQDDADRLLNERYKEAPAGTASRGEELSAKLDRIFEAIKNENDRLIDENKKIAARLERAEKTAATARRKAEAAVKTPEELKAKLNKERLDMHFNLAVVYEKNSLWQDAEREYLKCLRIDPKDAGVHYNLGILYDDKLNRNNKAMYHYYKFLSLRPMGETAERVRDWITKLELENRLGKEMR